MVYHSSTMAIRRLDVPFEAEKLDAAVDYVASFYQKEKGIDCARSTVDTCVSNWLAQNIENMVDDLSETLTGRFPAASNFERMLEQEHQRHQASALAAETVALENKVDVYSGYRA